MFSKKVRICLTSITILVTALITGPGAIADVPESATPKTSQPSLAGIIEHHPRLLLNDYILKNIHHSVNQNKLAATELHLLQKRGEALLGEAPVRFNDGDLLEVSRTALKRIYTLGLLYQLQPQAKWAVRAKKELFAIASFPSWHPEHFLDTAEMTHAMAIGYDWFYAELSDSEREVIRTAILNLGLKPGIEAVRTQKYFWVSEHRSNWNLVCFGGLMMGVLALGHDRGVASASSRDVNDEAEALLPVCVENLRQSIDSFNPDGAWCEGPSYWNYGTIYAATAIASLQTALGKDFDLSNTVGLSRAGFFYVDERGTSGQLFDFADASPEARNSPQLFWFSHRYNKPALAFYERYLMEHANEKLDARDLIWFSEAGTEEELKNRPLKTEYRGITQLVTLRSSRSAEALYVAFKGGDNKTHHSHLELGTFVFDAAGCRWVSQLGMENYDVPGFFNTTGGDRSSRWSYYRTRTEGANTIVVDGANQDVRAVGMIKNDAPTAISALSSTLDLSDAYKSKGVSAYTRLFAMSPDTQKLLVMDDLTASRPFEASWQIHTRAVVSIHGNQAILSLKGKRVLLSVLSPANAILSSSEVTLPPPQAATSGMQKLSINCEHALAKVRFAIVFTPFVSEVTPPTPALTDFIRIKP